jgi:holo-[acyl-carrier protein] synthase
MIVGVGIDIIEVDRVAAKVNKGNAFKEKIFSPEEIIFCESKAEPAQNYAARFASKEAFLKATGKGLLLGFELRDIEVVQDELGKPSLVLHGKYKDLAKKNNWNKIHLSISHIQSAATAVVIIES